MERAPFSTRIDAKLVKSLKFLAVEKEKPLSHLLEEAIKDLLKKYEGKGK